MTDRYNYLTVALSKDLRDDDAEMLINAISMIKGVVSVKGNVVDSGCYLEKSRVRDELLHKIIKLFDGDI